MPNDYDRYDDVYFDHDPAVVPLRWRTPGTEEDLDRLTHLVFLDGRLLDAWTEPAAGTRWQESAARLDRERRPALPPPRPPYAQVLDWLAAVCGGPAAVAELDDAPLTDDRIDLPADLPDVRSRHRLESAAELLDSVCAALFDAETSYAARYALLALWAETPELVLGSPSAAHLAGGILWAVGKANGCYRPRGGRTQSSVQQALALTQAISGPGGQVARALRGLLATVDRPSCAWGWIPDLEPLGDPGLLTSTTRRQLVRLRDRAVRDRATAEVAADVTAR